ncbi:Uncharacterized membrane-anchored protein [Dendrosporobacter quercicolus]|uniref:Uncharacterized membrane-anchored protein n=1 Tax=Dendrosporobacter quercicolus TaxID=146817 RepID=A0A1G9TYY7_9FIRM|nr:GDYXXLXY domain-containing protein [Dendrosporobacter quercicolus]SDM52475.1 Uncharacterized membrane-anchored protein [Dendrosporobacter quercicolus]
MKRFKLRFILLIGLAVIQLAALLAMAWHWENILQTGQRFYWATAPVDPHDAFRGRYIDLSFKDPAGPLLDPAALNYGQTAYAIVAADQSGRAVITGVSAVRPSAAPYVKVTVRYTQGGDVHVDLPFKRYYLPEDSAPAAETAYRKRAVQTGVAAVRLKNGYGVVEELYIEHQPLADYLQNSRP